MNSRIWCVISINAGQEFHIKCGIPDFLKLTIISEIHPELLDFFG